MGGVSASDFDPTNWSVSGVKPFGTGDTGKMGTLGGKNQNVSGTAPTSPDFAEAARIQAESSLQNTREQTRANRPNQGGIFGNSTWTQDANGNWTQDLSLAPGLQGASDALQGQIRDSAATPAMTGDAARDQAIQGAYSQAASRLDPQWSQREAATATQLANEGFSRGDAGYQNAMGDLGRQRNDAYTSAMNSAIGQGTQAGAATFAQNLAAKMAPYQQAGQLRGLASPEGFTAAGSAQPLQSLAAAMQKYQGDLQNYGIQQQGKNSKTGGASNIASLALMA